MNSRRLIASPEAQDKASYQLKTSTLEGVGSARDSTRPNTGNASWKVLCCSCARMRVLTWRVPSWRWTAATSSRVC